MGTVLRFLLTMALLLLSSGAAMADDWAAVRLRGAVLQLIDGEWHKLGRGDVVPDNRVIRTLRNGSVEFERGGERVALGPDTAIQIYDEIRKRPFTTVKQYFGTVTVEANVEDVQHFAVQTHYLAAVVKGTKFSVTAGTDGASVAVERGSVFVVDRATRNDVTIIAGQSATVDDTSDAPQVQERKASFGSLLIGKAGGEAPDDEHGKGKNDEKSNNGKSGNDDSEGDNGRPDKSDKSDKGKSDDDQDNSGKGKSGRSDDDDHPGKGKSGGGDDDDHDDDD